MNYPESLYEWIDFWLEYYKKPTVKPVTYQCCVYNSHTLKRYARNIPLSEIDEFYCQLILNKMFDDGYSKATINKISRMLKQSLLRAKRCGCIFDNPTDYLVIPNAPTKKVEALTIEEQRKIEKVCTDEKQGYLFLFMLYTGIRRSELINLKWQHFSNERREIFIADSKTKNGIRTIPLIKPAYAIVTRQLRSKQDDYIFHSAKGKQLSNTILKSLYNHIRKLTGISSFTNHVCRHSFATRLIERHANPKSVATLLGHARVEYALNIYTSIEKQQLRKEIHLLENN